MRLPHGHCCAACLALRDAYLEQAKRAPTAKVEATPIARRSLKRVPSVGAPVRYSQVASNAVQAKATVQRTYVPLFQSFVASRASCRP